MSGPDPRRLFEALRELNQRAVGDHRLLAESQRARREYFGESAAAGAPAPTAMQEHRFLEWFLLERESLSLAAVPVDVLTQSGDEEGLLGSTAGVYRVESMFDGGVEVRDLQEDEAIEVACPAGALRVGDLMVGRMYAGERGGWQPSAAVAVYRPGQTIAVAFQRDYARLELDRRLSQLEVEHLLLRRQSTADLMPEVAQAPPVANIVEPGEPLRPVEHIEADLEAVLTSGGARGVATEVSDVLLAAERPGPVVGPLLDQLAFDTEVDLDRARRLMLELWASHRARTAEAMPPAPEVDPPPTTAVPGETLGERLVRTLDAGLGKKQDLDELFRQLEAMAGIEPDEEEEEIDEDLAAALQAAVPATMGGKDDDYDGDLEPLIAEFVWETNAEGSADAAVLQGWCELQRNAALPHTDVEQITGQDLMRLLLHVYLRAEPKQRATAVRAAFAGVERFSAWAESTQELSLRRALDACQGAILAEVERLQDAGLRLSGNPTGATAPAIDPASPPGLLRIEEVGKDGFGVRADDSSHWVTAGADQLALLRPGDLLLAALDHDDRRVRLRGPVVALPGDAEALIG